MKNEKPVTNNNDVVKEKSEILFLYESTYSIPNGDPFTGEQRYDEETKKVLVSDVRIKRFIRDYLSAQGQDIYVVLDRSQASNDGKESGSAARMKSLKEKFKNDDSVKIEKGKEKVISAQKLLLKCIDVRLFGGISTEEDDAVNITGPIQFALLNPSLNESELRMHQNTCVFPSQIKNTQGSIGTTSIVPYCINQIHGWINPFSAVHTGLTNNDVNLMFEALWKSINFANTRTKSNQNSLLLLQIVYSQPEKKIYGIDRLIKINTGEKDKKGEQLRNIDDVNFDFSELIKISDREEIKEIRYYTIIKKIEAAFENKAKFKKMDIENK